MDRFRISARRLLAAVAVLGLLPALAGAPAALAAPADPGPATSGPHEAWELLAKAQVDECFDGIGMAYPPGPPCASGQAKVNQSYLWGITRAGKDLWFGTGANVNCLTSGRNLRNTTPNLNEDWVCEYGESQIAKRNPTLPPTLGDHRPPRIYTYDTRAERLTEKTGLIREASTDDANRLTTTAGIRAAGTHRGVAFVGGPALGESINLFAFDTDTGGFLGSVNLPAYGNIRHFVVADGELYAGVGVGANGGNRGHVLRWTGSKTDPFRFAVVADLPAQAADLTVHAGRIFVTTWPGDSDDTLSAPAPAVEDPTPGFAAVWMSPLLFVGDPGLTTADAGSWQQVWNVSSYEPDPVVARAYALGGLASYGGYLFWGTMHVPLKATTVHLAAYPPKNEAGVRATVQNTQRAISVFQGRNLGTPWQNVELLYGAVELPAFDPAANGGTGAWRAASTGYTPKHGTSGMGNPYNNYTWKMVVAGGKLFVGTMDWSYISKELGQQTAARLDLPGATAATLAAAPALGATPGVSAAPPPRPDPVYGADLFAFLGPNRPAEVVNNTGLGNYLNYGVRNMVSDGSTVYLGMANPMNLRTDPDDDVPEGGWELLKINAWRY
ncbi:hypothetical protein [Polymorphospora rubra]|uniref:Uncharacterized protein n=1 Tax=Polymorphospora rubra TaxID=338584 RepID=A0A810N511_9ACTN|nr:hypothetical protein [Polymorphospora rubra]BCJ68030.1 hypothetical protein Prubr_50510 [Polymorphospora rubra]